MTRVKLFDYEHEKDLEKAINLFLESDIELLSIHYQTCHFYDNDCQIYSFSAMVVYNKKE